MSVVSFKKNQVELKKNATRRALFLVDPAKKAGGSVNRKDHVNDKVICVLQSYLATTRSAFITFRMR